jgi:endonuclease/exonuclease/phosphatase family metal-dependent hydrolase
MTLPIFSILTLNLRFGLAEDGPYNWIYRKKLFPELLARHPADFYCFQEANDFQIDFLKRHLKDHRVIGRRHPAPDFWQNNVVFHHRRWECTFSDSFFLSPTPSVPSRSIDSKWPRQCTLGEFHNKDSGLACINTHFDFAPRVQADSANMILDRIAALPSDLPVLICGDFNSSPGEAAHDLFLESGAGPFKNIFSPPFPGTHHGFKGNTDGEHIDWILFRGGVVKQAAKVIATGSNGIFPSDHFPVTATFSWGDGE